MGLFVCIYIYMFRRTQYQRFYGVAETKQKLKRQRKRRTHWIHQVIKMSKTLLRKCVFYGVLIKFTFNYMLFVCSEEKEDSQMDDVETMGLSVTTNSASSNGNGGGGGGGGQTASATVSVVTAAAATSTIAPTATPDVDEDGYSIQPKEPQWETLTNNKGK